jgi:hypothetical protein
MTLARIECSLMSYQLLVRQSSGVSDSAATDVNSYGDDAPNDDAFDVCCAGDDIVGDDNSRYDTYVVDEHNVINSVECCYDGRRLNLDAHSDCDSIDCQSKYSDSVNLVVYDFSSLYIVFSGPPYCCCCGRHRWRCGTACRYCHRRLLLRHTTSHCHWWCCAARRCEHELY